MLCYMSAERFGAALRRIPIITPVAAKCRIGRLRKRSFAGMLPKCEAAADRRKTRGRRMVEASSAAAVLKNQESMEQL